MTADDQPPISDHVVRYLAGRGEDEVNRMQDLANRARALLASGGLTPEDITAYWWELDKESPPGETSRIWAAYFSRHATGEGLTKWVYITDARDEARFRRLLAWELDRDTAHAAVVGRGLDALGKIAPEALPLIAPSIRERLARIDRNEDRPAAFSVLIRVHMNYS
jgi:hypothetical protein